MGYYLLAKTRCMIQQSHIKNRKGQGMVEYALIIAFVVVIAAGLVNSSGIQAKIGAIFNNLDNIL